MDAGKLSAKVISYLFHPLLLPTGALFLIFNLGASGWWVPSYELQLFLYSATLLATFLLPLISSIVLLQLKVISSLEMRTKEERRLPYLAAAIFYFAEAYLLLRLDVPHIIQAMLLGATLLLLLTLLINVFWQISSHMIGIGGVCGMLLALSFRLQVNTHGTLIALFLIAGAVAFARLKLNAHTPAQVYTGFLLGLSVQAVFLLTL